MEQYYALPQAKLRLLMVEDSRSEAAASHARLMIAAGGQIDIDVVASFKAAVEMLQTHEFSAVLLDLGLPDMEPSAMLSQLRTEFPALPVIILSGHEEEVAVLRSLHYGAEEFLAKSTADGEAIWHAIARAVFRKSLKKTARGN